MIIGAIADIHGNLPALNAVLRDMPPVDAILCAGDMTGYYPYPNEVCDRVRESGAFTVRGNHDAYVLGELRPAEDKPGYRTGWVRDSLTPANRSWLRGLPVEMVFRWGGSLVRLRHASPWDEETYLYPDSPHLERIRLEAGETLVVGHTHWPLSRICGDGRLLNPGSVGQPRDWNPLASYALVDMDDGSVVHRRVPYDVGALQDVLAGMEWEPGSISILSRKR